jgi:hypothetical protein
MDAISGGERALVKMVANKTITGKMLFDQTLYPLNDKEKTKCADYSPVFQDFDKFFRRLNILSKESLKEIKEGSCPAFPPSAKRSCSAAVLALRKEAVGEQFKYRQATFFKVTGFKEVKKYRMLAAMAAIKICGRLYAVLDAVDVQVKEPIIITLKN